MVFQGLILVGIGFVLGWGFGRKFVPAKKRCRHVKPDTSISGYSMCPGVQAVHCVERMCPSHCQMVHGGKCQQIAFGDYETLRGIKS